MIVKLFDGTELLITKNASERLKTALERNSDGYVTINDHVIRKSAIAVIKPGGEPKMEQNLLAAHDYRGENSEAKERVRKMLVEKGLIK